MLIWVYRLSLEVGTSIPVQSEPCRITVDFFFVLKHGIFINKLIYLFTAPKTHSSSFCLQNGIGSLPLRPAGGSISATLTLGSPKRGESSTFDRTLTQRSPSTDVELPML